MKNQLSQVTVTQTLSVILFSEQKLTHFTNISCEIQQNVIELIKHLSKHLPLRFNLATNEISLTKSPLNPAQCYTKRFHQTEPFGSLILSTLIEPHAKTFSCKSSLCKTSQSRKQQHQCSIQILRAIVLVTLNCMWHHCVILQRRCL